MNNSLQNTPRQIFESYVASASNALGTVAITAEHALVDAAKALLAAFNLFEQQQSAQVVEDEVLTFEDMTRWLRIALIVADDISRLPTLQALVYRPDKHADSPLMNLYTELMYSCETARLTLSEHISEDYVVSLYEELLLQAGERRGVGPTSEIQRQAQIERRQQLSSITGSASIEKLNALIGLETVKEDVITLRNIILMQQKRGRALDIPLHVAFLGNPGTGKTVVARLYGEILYELGILPTKTLVECTRTELIGEYIGHTGPKTRTAVDRAMGGVLFLDEAHTLIPKDISRDFGYEALSELNKLMEDRRGEFVVVMAGYEDEFQRILKAEPGLSSRMTEPIHFPDYSDQDLLAILLSQIRGEGLIIDESDARTQRALLKLIRYERESKGERVFGNARGARNICKLLLRHHANILARTSPDNLDIVQFETVSSFCESRRITGS